MKNLQKFVPIGGLDTDTDPVYIKQGWYRSALNIQHLTDSTGSTQAIIPMKGSTEAFSLGSVSVQNKTYRIYTEQVATAQVGSVVFTSANGINFYTAGFSRNIIVTAQAAQIAALVHFFVDSTATVIGTGTTTGYIDITLNEIIGYDLILTAFYGFPTATTPLAIEILNEAYDISLTGELHSIGSFDLLGDLYVWSTPQTNLPLTTQITLLAVLGKVVGTRTLYELTFDAPHGLVAGESITLRNIQYTNFDLNGVWIVNASGLTATKIVLSEYYSNFIIGILTPGTIEILTNVNGIGEIGVGQYNANTDSWSYTRLIRTRQWGFRTKKQPDTYCEQTAIKSSIYWTDDFNVPRAIYYIYDYDINGNKSAFIQDGIISTINPSGPYTYSTIELESRLQLSSAGSRLTFLQQLQSGGQIASGNWRYSIRFLSESLIATESSDLTNPINVYSANSGGNPALIIGDEPGIITGKINQLSVTGIIPGLFKYIELIGVNYVGNGVIGYKIKREILDSSQTSITLNHTGAETDTENFDLGLLNQQFANIATAKNIDVIDKIMILSNLTTRARIDFSAWAQTFTHSVLRQSIDAVKDNITGTLQLGEYQNPDTVNNFMGLMQNETYRFSFKGHFKKGGFTENYFIDDIIINCDSTNTASTNPNRRIIGLADFDLTDGGAAPSVVAHVYAPYINFSNIDFDYKIDGIPISDYFDFIEIERAEVVNPTILACGIAVPSMRVAMADVANNYQVRYGVSDGIGEYPFFTGRSAAASNPQYSNAEFVASNRDRTVVAFYSPDIWFGHKSISFSSGDGMINHGNPNRVNFNNGYTSVSASNVASNYVQYSGITGATGAAGVRPVNTQNLQETIFLGYGDTATLSISGKIYRKIMALINTVSGDYSVNSIAGSLVAENTGTIFAPLTGQISDGGFYYNQYYRPIGFGEQYGNIATTKYVTCGHRMNIDSSISGFQNTNLFGGDTFTQLTYLKHRSPSVAGIQFPGLIAPAGAITGFAGGLSFYSQNRINSQMKQKSASQTGTLYPGIPTADWLTSSTNTDGLFGEAYQNGYTIRNEVKSDIAFDPDLEQTNDFPSRIIWSAVKPQGSASDQYRVYLPLDFHDLDQTNGEIVHHANGNGELITWQQRAFMRQYFNTRGTLEVKGITEILIGDGSVMSRDGVTISRLGSKHKWSVIKGKSQGGNDIFYWLNTEIKKALRFGYDGTVSIADVKGMQSFIANNVAWVNLKDTPADGEGICGFWDDRYADAGWTVRAKKPTLPAQWGDLSVYNAGAIVTDDGADFSGLQIVYQANGVVPAGKKPNANSFYWTPFPLSTTTYYNYYTLIFNEFKNAFTTFASYLPKIYLKWTDTFLSPRPIAPEYKIYQHNKGNYLTWYLHNGVSQTEQGYIEGVINRDDESTKWMDSIAVDSEITPERFDFATKNHASFLTSSEFEMYEDSFFGPVKEDSTTTGINDGNTTLLFGKYMLAKMYFAVGVYQKLTNFIVKYTIGTPFKNK